MISSIWRLVDDPGDRRRFVTAAVLAMVSRAATVLLLFPVLNELFSPQPSAALPWMAALAGSVGAGWWVDRKLALAGYAIGFDLLTGLERRVHERVLRLPVTWHTAERKQNVQQAVTMAGYEMCSGVAYLLTPALSAIGSTVFIAIGLAFVSPWLGLIAIVAIPVILTSLAVGERMLRSADNSYASASAEAGRSIAEFARAQRVLRASGHPADRNGSLARALQRQRSTATRLARRTVPGELLFGLVTLSALVVLATTAALLFLNGDLSGGSAVAATIVILRFVEPFTSYAGLAPALAATRASVARIAAILNAPDLPEPQQSATPDPAAATIELDRVSFRYGDGPLVLDDVSLTIPPGTTTAIVGPSGSGKSTILSLVARSMDVHDGAIRVRGNDVREYHLDALIEQVAMVDQEVYLFDASLRENVAMGRRNASAAEVMSAGATAQLTEVVDRLPGGWDANVGAAGDRLSGGEKQRVSVARALVRQAPVLLLDEATSALDANNERALVAALESDSGHRTTLVVAHRLSTIANADQIVFLEGGRATERGTLDELLRLDGRFASYWRERKEAAGWALL